MCIGRVEGRVRRNMATKNSGELEVSMDGSISPLPTVVNLKVHMKLQLYPKLMGQCCPLPGKT